MIFNSDNVEAGEAQEGVHDCPLPVAELTDNNRNKLVQNTVALGTIMHLLDLDFQILEDILTMQFQRKGQEVIDENIAVARAGFDYAKINFESFPDSVPVGPKPLAVWTGTRRWLWGRRRGGEILLCLPDESIDPSSPLDG